MKHPGRERSKFRRAKRRAEMALPAGYPGLVFMTDPARVGDAPSVVRQLPAGSLVIYRHYGAADRLEAGRALARACRLSGCRLLVSADPALARRLGADGLHIPEKRLGQARLRRAARAFRFNTASAHSRRAIERAQQAGVSAALLSPVFPSQSPSAGRALGIQVFRSIALNARLPVYGLGGIEAQTAGAVARVGGIAAISALAEAFGSRT